MSYHPRLSKRAIAEMRAALGHQLASCRRSRRMTQEDVAVRLDMSRSTIAMIERGRQAMTVDQLFHFASLFETEPRWLLTPGAVLWHTAS